MDCSLDPVRLYCPNCGHKVIGYRARDETVRICCERCRIVIFSKRKDRATLNLRLTAPNEVCEQYQNN
jgi:hypothetical protein